ncbi:hypothetical protein CAL29_06460 [Bordetella genomosp. 10]|uniref:Lipoprotein n=2 Tax=Bordetella genomosp. 10 TaxID=1416804 RepID=A0A261SKR9_9BORD|nr:hypothetical protein CAL29_06460 [Bordetella genomosp. 10]
MAARRLIAAAAAGLTALLAGCVSNGNGNMTLDFGEVLAQDQQTFTVNGERAARRRYVDGSYDIKLYQQRKVMDLGLPKNAAPTVANVADVAGATLITLDVPQADCAHVYSIYQVMGGQSRKWQNSYRSCEAPLAFNVVNGQWTARQTVRPRVGDPYILVYQDGNLYTRTLAMAKPAVAKKKAPVRTARKPASKPADSASNLDAVAAPAAADLDAVAAPAVASGGGGGGADLDAIEAPVGKVNTAGLKADQANPVKMKDE